jgi:hypothetical protein
MRLGAGDENVININEDVGPGGALRRVEDEQGVKSRSDKTKFQEVTIKAGEPSTRGLFEAIEGLV